MKKFLLLLSPAALAAQTIKPVVETCIEHGIKTDSIVLVDNVKTNIFLTPSGDLFVPVKEAESYRRVYLNSKGKKPRTHRRKAVAAN